MKLYIPNFLQLFLPVVLVFAIGFNSNAQDMNFSNDPYSNEWKEVEKLQSQSLPKSALKKVESLYQRALAENNPSQQVKTLMHIALFTVQLEEDGQVKAIYRLEKELAGTTFPAKNILQSVLGELYYNYAEMNSWRISNRTHVSDGDDSDILTWDMQKFLTTSNDYYLNSVNDADQLTHVELKDLNEILVKKDAGFELRPHLYDLLMHRAIDHFSNGSMLMPESSASLFSNEDALAPLSEFIVKEFAEDEMASYDYKVLKLFKVLLASHENDSNKAALLDADLKRLEFVYKNLKNNDISSVYEAALERFIADNAPEAACAEAYHRIAKLYAHKAAQYDPMTNPESQWAYKKAKEICEDAIRDFPDSFGAKKCLKLITEIEQKELRTEVEKVVPSSSSILYKIRFRNINQVYIKLIPFTSKEATAFGRKENHDKIKYLKTIKPSWQGSETLPDQGDYQPHTTEAFIPKQKYGIYCLIVSDNKDFEQVNGAVNYAFFNISDLAVMKRQNFKDNNTHFLVVDRTSGQPLEGVKAEIYSIRYNNLLKKNKRVVLYELYSDANGHIASPVMKDGGYNVEFSKGKDVLFPDTRFYQRQQYYYEPNYDYTVFFKDRSIYRPGQSIYFKAILMQKDENGVPSIVAAKKVDITLYDANGQKVKTLLLRSNEYGSVHGSFQAPEGGLLGQMSIHSSFSNQRDYFRVEEYKRPTFEVEMDPVKGDYALGEDVKLGGKAVGYAGNALNDAEVSYRVVREAYFPWWRGWYYRPAPRSRQVEIAHGQVQTNPDGTFEVPFTAIPDKSQDAKLRPAYHFKVYVDVTDITGETHSATATVSLGTLGLLANIDAPAQVDQNEELKIKLKTTNISGQFLAARGSIAIQQLESPSKVYVQRYWQKPDVYTIRKRDFVKNFPHLAYKNEDDIQSFPVAATQLILDFNTADSDSLVQNIKNWPIGYYVITLKTKDKSGVEIEDKHYFSILNTAKKEMPFSGKLYTKVVRENIVEPENNAKMVINSAPGVKMHYYVDVERVGGNLSRSAWNEVSDWTDISFPIRETDRGGIQVRMAGVKYNRFYSENEFYTVPWTNKELNMTFETFRDKLKPGQKESWRIKITGSKGEKVAAEMLASMYDASLDAFVPHSWSNGFYPRFQGKYHRWQGIEFGNQYSRVLSQNWNPSISIGEKAYPALSMFGMDSYRGRTMYMSEGIAVRSNAKMAMPTAAGVMADEAESVPPPPPPSVEADALVSLDEGGTNLSKEEATDGNPPKPQIRTNLNETVFFKPNLMTDAEGNVTIEFTMNEALTKWKFMTFAHTKDLETAMAIKEVITQKELMVQPNAPRFLREGDRMSFTAKVSNLTESAVKGTAELQLFDALTMEPIDALMANNIRTVNFVAEAGQSAPLSWDIEVPYGKIQAVTYRVIAQTENHSDGEENVLPVLTNRMLVTETMPFTVMGGKKGTFTFKRMKELSSSNTLANHTYSLEFTSNPVWYAVKALPYLMEYPYDCTEQIFSRFYANSLASHVANSQPNIKAVLDSWENTDALESELFKNQDLKSAILEETPWVLDAQSESQQRKNIALLFDMHRMAKEQTKALAQLRERQSANGGYAWFPGGRESRYITQYLVEGFGRLKQIGVESGITAKDEKMIDKAVVFIDNELKDEYNYLKKQVKKGETTFEKDHLSQMAIHYLYARSFHQQQMDDELSKVVDYYKEQAKKHWTKKGIYQQALMAIALNRMGEKGTAQKMIASFNERAIHHKELGMYWKYDNGYYWYQMPIETHSLMIEVYSELTDDAEAIDEMRLWLLRNKETNNWKTTKATTNAIYALLLHGDNWLADSKPVKIAFTASESATKDLEKAQADAEPGSGYFDVKWDADNVNTSLAEIKVKNPNKHVSWGAMYWQYFEDLDKVTTFEETPLQIKKSLFLEKNTDDGPALTPIDDTSLNPGDLVKVRIEIRVDRAMEYIHLKDMRASGFEPINVLSQYKWQDGLGYYESTGDLATHFFIDYLPRGTYIFEYPLRVVHKGDFSNGVTTMQCMYAPAYTSHSEGERVVVE